MFVGVEISSADDRKSISKGFRSGRSFRYVKSTDDEKEASPSQSNSTWRQQQQHTPRGDLLILKPAISPSPPKFPISPASAPIRTFPPRFSRSQLLYSRTSDSNLQHPERGCQAAAPCRPCHSAWSRQSGSRRSSQASIMSDGHQDDTFFVRQRVNGNGRTSRVSKLYGRGQPGEQ